MVVQDARPRLLILFGSQTGNAQDAAERVAREAKRRHYRPQVLAMDAYNVANLPQETTVVFLASTTGQGENPNNMKHFWRFLLRKSLPRDSLQSTRYAVFGLGDSGYINFNTVAKKLDRRLAALGGCAIMERGLGDDQHPSGYEAALDPWLRQLWAHLRLQHPLPCGINDPAVDEASAPLGEPKFRITHIPCPSSNEAGPQDEHLEAVTAFTRFNHLASIASGITELVHKPSPSVHAGSGPDRPCLARMVSNTRLTAEDHFQDTRHIEFDLGAESPMYEPGDILTIFPRQNPASVLRFLEHLQLDPQAWVRIQLADPPPASDSISMEVRLGALVAGVLDVDSSSPRRFFFEILQHFATDELQQERLQYFGSAEGREDLALYNQSEGRTVLEVLKDFGTARPPLDWLLQAVPRLQPRQFSIASSQRAHPGQAHITLAVVDYRTPHKRRKMGLCSSWLARLDPQGAGADVRVPVWVDRGVLHLPEDNLVPLIMVGPGTGVAPFRAFMEERCALLTAGAKVAPSYLYFGCRGANLDFYYREQWQHLVSLGILAEEGGLVTAFSRDQGTKVYVTHRLREHAAQLWGLLQEGARVYISGSAEKMPQEVANVFREDVLMTKGGLLQADAQKYLRQMELTGRYVVEAWS